MDFSDLWTNPSPKGFRFYCIKLVRLYMKRDTKDIKETRILENLVMTFIISKKLVEECQVTTGYKLPLVYMKSTVIWNWSVVGTREDSRPENTEDMLALVNGLVQLLMV